MSDAPSAATCGKIIEVPNSLEPYLYHALMDRLTIRPN